VRRVASGPPTVSWCRFFRSLTPEGQGSLEQALSQSGLLLGEYIRLRLRQRIHGGIEDMKRAAE